MDLSTLDFEKLANGLLVLIVGLLSFFGIKRGMNRPPASDPGRTVEVAGALVDSRAVKELTGEITGQSMAIMTQSDAIKKQTELLVAIADKQIDAMEDHTRAMRDLRDEIHNMGELGRAITDLATQIARRGR